MIKRQERPPRPSTLLITVLTACSILEQPPLPLLLTGSISTKMTASMFLGRRSRAPTYWPFEEPDISMHPLKRFSTFFSDVKHEIDWVDRLEENILISEDIKNFERVEFHSYGLPWPVWSRDIVFKIKLTRLKSDTFLVTMKSVDDSLGPPTKGVRAELHGSNFILRQTADGKTWVEVDIFIDPKGEVPAFLVNILQRYWPYNTIMGLRSQVKNRSSKHLQAPPTWSLQAIRSTKCSLNRIVIWFDAGILGNPLEADNTTFIDDEYRALCDCTAFHPRKVFESRTIRFDYRTAWVREKRKLNPILFCEHLI